MVPPLGRRARDRAARRRGPTASRSPSTTAPTRRAPRRCSRLLREAGAAATFFLAGEQVERRPALAAEIVAAGHRVELHCHRHRNQLRLTPRALLDDAERARAAIEEASGQAIADYRPPYGIFSASGLRADPRAAAGARSSGRCGGGTGRGGATPESIARRATAGARAGDVLLLHDADYYSARGSWVRTAAALPIDPRGARGRGLKSRLLRR